MAFDEVRFPTVIAQGATGGPGFSTAIAATASGYEQRQQNWPAALRRWNVGSGIRQRADLQTLIAFFIARRGRARGFRFKDWSDFEAARTQIGTTDGTTATYQLAKTYTDGVVSVSRTISKPVSGSVRCWVNNVEIALGAGAGEFQVSTTTGVITLGTTLAATTGEDVEASCEFDVPVRFDTDDLPLVLRMFENGEWPDIPITELRL